MPKKKEEIEETEDTVEPQTDVLNVPDREAAPQHIKGFTLVNAAKFERAINGTVHRAGTPEGGVGDDASDDEILAEYDRLGGLIQKGKNNVKTGCFYDFKNKKPRDNPKVILVFRNLEGQSVEISDTEEIPADVRAAEAIREKNRKAPKKLADGSDEEEE